MERIVMVLGVLLITSFQGVAQEETNKTKQNKEFNDKVSSVHELGLNATFFINTFVSFNTVNPTVVSPYAFTYKYRKGRGALRFGIGGTYRQEQDNDPGDTFKTANGELDVRIGGEFNTPIGKRWRTSVGADAVFSYDISKSENGSGLQFVETKLSQFGVGAGPVLGIDFMVAKRIKLGTETSVMFKYSREKQESNFVSSSIPDTEDNDSSFEVLFDLPTSLYLIIMF